MRVVAETWEIVPLPIYAMVAMPNQWHFVVRPETSDQVSEFFRRLTVMHTMRWHAHYETGGNPALPRNWRSWVNKVETEAELTSLRHSVRRGLPFGDDQWTKSSAVRLGLETTTRPRGRPGNET